MASWLHRAACRDTDPELFFPVGTGGTSTLQLCAAKKICKSCPVLSHCLSWSLKTGQDSGVWGGLSEEERRALLRMGRKEHLTRDDLVELVQYGSLPVE